MCLFVSYIHVPEAIDTFLHLELGVLISGWR